MNKKYIAAIVVIIAIVAVIVWKRPSSEQPPAVIPFNGQAAAQAEANSNRDVSISDYITANLAGFSAEEGFPATLGGTFKVSKITAANGKGTVEYSDGHNAYSAEFAYTLDKKGLVSVTAFVVKK